MLLLHCGCGTEESFLIKQFMSPQSEGETKSPVTRGTYLPRNVSKQFRRQDTRRVQLDPQETLDSTARVLGISVERKMCNYLVNSRHPY